jgi:hypothetical protein
MIMMVMLMITVMIIPLYLHLLCAQSAVTELNTESIQFIFH